MNFKEEATTYFAIAVICIAIIITAKIYFTGV